MHKSKEEKTQIVSFRIPKNMIEFLDSYVDGVYIRDRTHVIRLLLETSYKEWLKDKDYFNKHELIENLFTNLFKGDEEQNYREAKASGTRIVKKKK